MPDYHVTMRSNAAPFFSDTDTIYLTADNPLAALAKARANYKHPCGRGGGRGCGVACAATRGSPRAGGATAPWLRSSPSNP